MIEPDPLDRGRIERRLQLNRRSRAEALRLNLLERGRLEAELAEIDEAIAGVSAMEMAELRAWSERLDRAAARLAARRSEERRDEALDQTFPASDPPAYTAPGSTVGS